MSYGHYDPEDLESFEAVLNAALAQARSLGVGLDEPDGGTRLKTSMATAIFGCAASGERDAARLRAHALAAVLDGITVLDALPQARRWPRGAARRA